MAEKTGIAWTDSTFNPWIGCEAISPGCKNCYAAAYAKRVGRDFAQRTRTSESNWKEPLKWEKKAAADGKRHLVFCASLADVFDNEVPEAWRVDLGKLIERTPHLTWLLLTKRIGNVKRMLPNGIPWPHVWLGVSVVNQEEADRDIPKLLAIPAAKRFVSYEPALGPVDWLPFFRGFERPAGYRTVDWIIVGGESTQGKGKARPFDTRWAYSTLAQCKAAGVPCFIKQLGSRPLWGEPSIGCALKDRAGADPAEWPEDLRVQEFPA